MGTVKAVLLETNTKAIGGLERFYRSVFERLGYDVAFTTLSAGNALRNPNSSIFDTSIVDVFICDLTLGHEDIVDGLSLIQKIKQRYPCLLIVANSRASVDAKLTAARVPNYDVFVRKQQIHDPMYVNYVANQISTLFKRNPSLEFDFDRSQLSEEFRHQHHKVALESIVRELTFTCHNADLSTAISHAWLERMDEGLSTSQVYKLFCTTENGLHAARAVLKLSKPERAARETSCYLKYVKWYLPYKWRPELLGNAFWGSWGAVCYVLVDDDNYPFRTLSQTIQHGNFQRVDHAVEEIFRPHNQQWYNAQNVQWTDEDLVELYHTKWLSKNRSKVEKTLKEEMESLGILKGDRVSICGETLPLPEVFVLGVPRTGYSTCLCHRDLHLGNVLSSDRGDLVFIDFQDVGRGHVFEDFVVFESSIRTMFDNELGLEKAFQEERVLARLPYSERGIEDAFDELSPFGRRVARIRQLAVANFPKEPFESYLLGVAASSYGLFRFNWLSERQKLQHLSCLLAVGAELEAGLTSTAVEVRVQSLNPPSPDTE